MLKARRKYSLDRYWPAGLAPFPYQKAGVDFVLKFRSRRKSHYIAFAPGLGKTIFAAIFCNRMNLERPTKIFYVCPPFMRPNCEAEFEKWSNPKRFRLILSTELADKDVRKQIRREIKPWREKGEAVLIVDEAHYFNNEKSQRSDGLFRIAERFDRVIFMSGSPAPNSRPVELWPILERFAPDVFGDSFFPFARRYCGADKTPFGWKFDGFTNRAQFRKRLYESGFMLRIKKGDVDLGIPPKIESLLTVGPKMPPVISRLERKILAHYSPRDLVKRQLAKRENKADLHLAEYLRLIGEEKLKHVFPYVQSLLSDTESNLLIFANHKSVIDQLVLWLKNYRPLVITGIQP